MSDTIPMTTDFLNRFATVASVLHGHLDLGYTGGVAMGKAMDAARIIFKPNELGIVSEALTDAALARQS